MAGALALGLAGLAVGHVRLIHPGTGKALYWSDPGNVSVVIQEAGSDDIPDGSHATALRNAIDAWNDVAGSSARLVENTSPVQQARTDWGSSSIHLLLFDEDNSSGYFPSGSGTVAVTPIWFYSGGAISDADVLFNGKGFRFTTEGTPGRFDVQDVATHELGHLLGLDHTGVAGASMYPYVDTTVSLHRSLAEDDAGGLRHAYPEGPQARLTGRVLRSVGSGGVAGAFVCARDEHGRLAGSALADSSGSYVIGGLTGGTYTVYARPLDQPVSAANLTSGHTVVTDFEAGHASGTHVVGPGDTGAVPDLLVGPDVTVSLGRSSDNFPLRSVRGQTTALTIHGAGLVPGSTLTASDPDVTVTVLSWLGSLVTLQVTVPAGEPRGHVDLEVLTPGGDRSILPGGLEVTPPDPTVSLVAPTSGSDGGGTALVVQGTGFAPGARVVIGDRIYEDGEPGGCQVVDPTTILLTTGATTPGLHDVVVIDASGVEGRKAEAFTAAAVPTIDTIFPTAGMRTGGTELVLRGQDFATGLEVRIDGVLQDSVVRDSGERVEVTTDGGLEGGPYVVELSNPGGGVAQAAFSYVRPTDPMLSGATPAEAKAGTTVVLSGANLTPTTEVVVGADPDTGLGGVPVDDVVFLGADALRIILPQGLTGPQTVLVRRPDTGQADVLAAGVTYPGSSSSSGGGCFGVTGAPRSPGRALEQAAWMLALVVVVAWRARRRAAPVGAR